MHEGIQESLLSEITCINRSVFNGKKSNYDLPNNTFLQKDGNV